MSTSPKRPRLWRASTSLMVFGLGVAALWLWIGAGKLFDLALSDARTAGTWAQRFPAALVGAAACAEIGIGILGLLGRWRGLVIAGLIALGIFSTALVVWPPNPGQACGCMGSSVAAHAIEQVDPLIRSGGLAALHLVLFALAHRRAR